MFVRISIGVIVSFVGGGRIAGGGPGPVTEKADSIGREPGGRALVGKRLRLVA